MTFKHMPFIFHEDDLKTIYGVLVNGVQKRIQTKHEQILPLISTMLADNEKAPIDLLDTLNEYQKTLEIAVASIQYIMGSIVYDKEQGEAKTLSADTEVLEDLPDLEEDSLGVDDWGEEPVSLTSDHPEE